MDHFEPILANAINRVPLLETAGIQLFFNGPESFTPDNRYYLGEAPEVKNCYVATGFNSIGIQSSGGAGLVLSQWIKNGHPPMDVNGMDIRRIHPFQSVREYVMKGRKRWAALRNALAYRQAKRHAASALTILSKEKIGECWRRKGGTAPLVREDGVKPELNILRPTNWFRVRIMKPSNAAKCAFLINLICTNW